MKADVFVSESDDPALPLVTALSGNYPNPFNPTTVIGFDLKEAGVVSLEIFNIRGQKVFVLVNEYMPAGRYKVAWNGVDESGREVSSGVYFYRMRANEFLQTKRMILLK